MLLVAPPRLDLQLDTISTFFPVTPPTSLFAEEALLVTSTDDPYMDTSEALALQRALGIGMHVVEGGGHLNAESGYGPWPWVHEWAKAPSGK